MAGSRSGMEKLRTNINIMKQILLFLSMVIALGFNSCNNTTKESKITVITPDEVYDAVKNTDRQLIDVRTTEEYAEGHVAKSKNICVTEDDFEEKASKLNRNEPVYVYCRSGKRSAKAAQILKGMGFTEIYDMDGGILNWEKQGLQVE